MYQLGIGGIKIKKNKKKKTEILNTAFNCLCTMYMYMYLSDTWKILISSEAHNSETKIAEFQVLKKHKYYLEESRKL